MRKVTDRPYLDEKPLTPPHKQISYCLMCGQPGVIVKFAADGVTPIQAHVVHDFLPKRVCVALTWPPTPWMHTRVRLDDPQGRLLPGRPDPPPPKG